MSKFRVEGHNLKATIDGVEYQWVGGFGSVMQSVERGVKRGEVRMIGNVVFYAWDVSRCGWRRTVSWSTQQDIDVSFLREFKAEMFA